MFIRFFSKGILFILFNSAIILAQINNFHTNSKNNCKYCHVLETEDYEAETPSWQSSVKNDFYIPYTSSTLDARIDIPLGSSKLCLGCHDGVLTNGHSNFRLLKENQILGTNLNSSHPISFDYDSYLAFKDGELNDPASSPSGLGGTINSDLLVNGKMECISCHDAHNMTSNNNLLVMSNFKSRLCLTCHKK